MRNTTWFAAVCCIVSLSVSPAAAVPIEVGLRGGMNVARLDGDVADAFESFFGDELESRFAAHAGLWVAWRLAPSFVLQTEATWAQKGAHGEVTVFVPEPINVDVTYALTYIEVPVLARFEPGLSQVRPRLLFGTAIGVPVGGEVRVEALGEEEEEDLDDLLVEWSLIVGAGLSWPVGRGAMAIDLRFQPGLTEVAEDTDTRNRVWSTSVSFGW